MSGACKRFERPGREGLGLDGRALGTVTRSHLSASGSIDQSEQYQVWQRVAIDIYRERYEALPCFFIQKPRVISKILYKEICLSELSPQILSRTLVPKTIEDSEQPTC